MPAMKKTFIFALLVMCLAGCVRYDIDEILLQRQDISLTIRGTEVIRYTPDRFQIGYNDRKNEFRVFDDNLGNWFVLTCRERPSTEGQTLKADLWWTATNTTKSRTGLDFRVEKTDSKGHIWLWCEDSAIGVSVREL